MPPLTDKAASFARTETEEGTVGEEMDVIDFDKFEVSAFVDVKMAMEKPTIGERRRALLNLYPHATTAERTALFGAVAIFLARCDCILPPPPTPEPRS